MNVLSLFDGMSCGRLALDRAGLGHKVAQYFASEIDVHAITVAKKNYPDTIHIGSVTEIRGSDLPEISLLIGGSPCQGFSFAGRQLNFEDPRSKLFFEYVRLKEETKPKYFLLENVQMRQEYQDIISSYLGVKPVMINSSLVSAQERKRLYWTNIPFDPKIEDRRLVIEDILEDPEMIPVIRDVRAHPDGLIYRPLKAQCLDANYFKGVDAHGARTGCIQVGIADLNGHDFLKRVYGVNGKAPTLTAICGGNQERKIAIDPTHWRKLTPVECERLQTVPDNYTNHVSNSQRYKMLGNGWTIDVVAHIFGGIEA